jgi:hypothetical protein
VMDALVYTRLDFDQPPIGAKGQLAAVYGRNSWACFGKI